MTNRVHLPPPRAAEWIATQGCNLRCRHCGFSDGKPGPDELDTREARDMLDALADFGVERLGISGGEFSTRDDWQELLDHALHRFEAVMLTTNGFLGAPLAEALEARTDKARLHVSLSIDGRDAVHDKRRATGSYAGVVEMLEGLVTVEREVITTVARDNVDLLDPVLQLCLRHRVPVWTLQPALPVGRLDARDAFVEDGPQRIADLAHTARRRAGDRMRVHTTDMVPDDGEERRCRCGRDQIVVLPDGAVAACVFLVGERCGNLRDGSFRALWESDAMDAFRREAEGGCLALRRARRDRGAPLVPIPGWTVLP